MKHNGGGGGVRRGSLRIDGPGGLSKEVTFQLRMRMLACQDLEKAHSSQKEQQVQRSCS